MGLTRADLTDPKISDKDKAEIAVAIANYMSNDKWVAKTFLPVGILLTGHPGSRSYMRACVDSHKKLGYWITLAYDNYINPEHESADYNSLLPPKDIMDKIDTFVMPKWQSWGGVAFPYFWQLKFGINVMQDFEYIYCCNADCMLEKPEGFPELFNLMGDADIMSCGPVTDRSVNTTAFIAKSKVAKLIMEHFERHFIPFENYEKYTQEFGNAEGRFGRAIKDLGLKQIIVSPPKNEQLPAPGQGTWFDLVGLRHLHYEVNYAYRYKGIPPPFKYLDERYLGDADKTYIKLYEETGNPEVLKDWYAKD